jgi:hypothetical protein
MPEGPENGNQKERAVQEIQDTIMRVESFIKRFIVFVSHPKMEETYLLSGTGPASILKQAERNAEYLVQARGLLDELLEKATVEEKRNLDELLQTVKNHEMQVDDISLAIHKWCEEHNIRIPDDKDDEV